MKSTWFYLHSYRNRRLYSSNAYPLTHFLNNRSLSYIFRNQSSYVGHFTWTFLLLFGFIFITTVFFRLHIYVYNSFFGPFYYNLNDFIELTRTFDTQQSWFKKIEYIQIDLGENNILNPVSTYETIRRYSDFSTRRNHIATYKRVRKPDIYVKLPTRLQNNFHARHPFQFSLYSIRTLRCIVKQLQQNNSDQHWIEKSEYVKYINEQYSMNSTRFNILVLSKCGILVGYLYRPQYEIAFLPTREHHFSSNDIAFDATKQYCSYYPLIFCTFIFVWLFGKALFYLVRYLLNYFREKLSRQINFISFPLYLSNEVIDELWYLNNDVTHVEQLLELDRWIQMTDYKYDQQLFIIKNHFEQIFVVLFPKKLNQPDVDSYDSSPFIICPVTDIKKIVQHGGICYGKDLSWIPWPETMSTGQNYTEWLHQQLMDMSEDYKKQYEYRLQNEQGNEEYNPWNPHGSNRVRRRKNIGGQRREIRHDGPLDQYIREETNFRRLQSERQHIIERFLDQTVPASLHFIAKFRLQQDRNPPRIDSELIEQQPMCIVCQKDFEINDEYGQWPCPSIIPHILHSDCMLNLLRRNNTCPICRHPVEYDRRPEQTFGQFLNRLVF